MRDIYEELSRILPQERILRDEPMKYHTTFRIGGPADYYVCPQTEELPQLLAVARQCEVPLTVIGNGSNLLVGDGGIRGLVLEIGHGMDAVVVESGTRLRVGAGTLLSRAANAVADAGLGGMEFAAGIPGSLGGAVVMNAGAYGGEMKDILAEVTVLTQEGKPLTFSHPTGELDLGYRHSIISEREYLVTEAVLQLHPAPMEEIRAVMADLRQRRMDKQPLEYPSAGSTFKRPQGYFAGKLIEDAGLKGYRVGGAEVSRKHSGFVINADGATAADVRQLIADVQVRVEEQFGVHLEPEVKFLGEF